MAEHLNTGPPSGKLGALLAFVAVVVFGSAGLGYALFPQGDGNGGIPFLLLRPWLAAAGMIGAVVALHLWASRVVFRDWLFACETDHARWRDAGLGLLVMIVVHAAEIQLFGTLVWLYCLLTGEVGLGGSASGELLDFLYFSFATYTSLGFGDVLPQGAVRLIAGLEALTGLLLIGWTASLFVVVFSRRW